MVLVRQVFQIKYGHMDEVLSAVREMVGDSEDAMSMSRVLTDISGPFFTLIVESKAESVDAYWRTMQEAFRSDEMTGSEDAFSRYVESGYREFYTIEYEAES